MATENEQKYLTIEETAAYAHLPISAIYLMSSKDKLPGKIKLGHRTILIDRELFDKGMREMAGGGDNVASM
jgi:hypothetical protein